MTAPSTSQTSHGCRGIVAVIRRDISSGDGSSSSNVTGVPATKGP